MDEYVTVEAEVAAAFGASADVLELFSASDLLSAFAGDEFWRFFLVIKHQLVAILNFLEGKFSIT